MYPLGDNYYVYIGISYPLVGRLIIVGVDLYPLGDNYYVYIGMGYPLVSRAVPTRGNYYRYIQGWIIP